MALHGHYHLARQGLAADRPSTPGYDLIYYATDTGQLSIYDTVGAAWNNIGFSGLSDPVAIGDGGTGQTSATAAFNALDPLTTKGDIIVHDGTNSIRLAVGSDRAIIVADSGQTSGLRWSTSPVSHILISPTGTSINTVTGAAYADILGGNGSFMLDFTRYRQARITMWTSIQIGSTSVTVKIVDTTNTQDVTGTVTVNSTTASRKTSTWASLNSATYAGDANFEIQAIEGVGADVLRTYSAQLELR